MIEVRKLCDGSSFTYHVIDIDKNAILVYNGYVGWIKLLQILNFNPKLIRWDMLSKYSKVYDAAAVIAKLNDIRDLPKLDEFYPELFI